MSTAAIIPNGTQAPAEKPALSPGASRFDVQDTPYTVPGLPLTVQPEPTTQNPPAEPTVAAAATPTPAPVPAQKHPTWLLQHATDMGMHPLMIERLDTPELSQIVLDQQRAMLAMRADASQARTVQNPNPPGQSPDAAAMAAVASQQAAQTQAAPQPPTFDWGEWQDYDPNTGHPIPGKKRKYTDDDFNPALVNQIKGMATKIAGLESFIKTMSQQALETRERTQHNAFDAAFSKFPAVFGVGNAEQVKADPEKFERRRLVFGAARAMIANLPKDLATKMTIEQAVTAMAKSMFGADPVAAAARPAAPQPDFVNGSVARPTQAKPSGTPPGDARARDAVQKWFQDQASAQDQGHADGTTLDEFI